MAWPYLYLIYYKSPVNHPATAEISCATSNNSPGTYRMSLGENSQGIFSRFGGNLGNASGFSSGPWEFLGNLRLLLWGLLRGKGSSTQSLNIIFNIEAMSVRAKKKVFSKNHKNPRVPLGRNENFQHFNS